MYVCGSTLIVLLVGLPWLFGEWSWAFQAKILVFMGVSLFVPQFLVELWRRGSKTGSVLRRRKGSGKHPERT